MYVVDDDLTAGLGRIVEGMLARACPCRYRRFRAVCERDSRALGAEGYTSWEQSLLVGAYRDKVPRAEARRDGWWERGKCGLCGAEYRSMAEEYFRDAWIERLLIEPVLPDVGAPLHAAVPRCCPIYAAGPHARKDELHLLELHYPRISTEAWLAWLEEEAS